MQISGNTRRLALGAFILAGLLLIGFNATWLVRLLNPPLPASSAAVKTAMAQWRTYREAQAGLARKAEAADVLLAGWRVPAPHRETPADEPVSEAAPLPTTDEPPLPQVSGILEVTDPQGHSRNLAMVGGRVRAENDQISGYTILRITVAGVAFGRDGRHWFAPAPRVPFSVDRGQ